MPNQDDFDKIISSFASSAGKVDDGQESFKEEKEFLSQILLLQNQAQDLGEKKDKHTLRKWVMGWLLALTCFWLVAVIVTVWLAALSPNMETRKGLFELQQQQIQFYQSSLAQTNTFPFRIIQPRYCPVLFNLSDSVLLAFITSTTVSVLGLFLVAARWLYPNRSPQDQGNQ